MIKQFFKYTMVFLLFSPSIKNTHYEIIDKEFASQVNDFIEHYKPALKALAKK